MATIVLRSGKGSPLTNTEVDANFSNLNTGKLELGGTYSSGTANGVTYLNGSKVLTSGSALTFDGSVFSVTGAISATTTINGAINGTVGASTPSTGAFTSLSASGTSTLAAVNASGAVTGNKALLALGDAAFLASSTVPSYRWHISSGGITADRNIYEMRAYNAGGTDHALQIRTVNDANTTVKTIALFSDTYGLAVTGAISASGAAGTSFINLAGAGNAAPPAGVYYGLFPQATFGLGLVSRTDAGIALWAGATPVQRATISSTGLAVTGAITANSAAATAPFIASINGGEAMRINSAGNVGIGTSSPASKLHVSTGVAGNLAYFTDNINTDFYIKTTSSIATIGPNAGATNLAFQTSGVERARIKSNGALLVGQTTQQAALFEVKRNSGSIAYLYNNAGTGVQLVAGNTSWSAVSDERKKDIIEPIQNAIEKLGGMRTVIGKYKTDPIDKRRSFLIAQDVKSVFPEAVSEQNDKEKTLLLQYEDLIPVLVKAIQEQQALIASLTARLDAANL